MNTGTATIEHNVTGKAECDSTIQRRHSFLAPDESSSGGHWINRDWQHISTPSDITSAGSGLRPTLSTWAAQEDDRISLFKDLNKPVNGKSVHNLRQSFMQSAERQMYRPVMYDLQTQHDYNWKCASMRLTSMGYAPGTVQSVPMNIPWSCGLSRQQVVSQIQQNQEGTQNGENSPVSTYVCPYKKDLGTFTRKNNLEAQQSSPIASSPLFGYISSPGYVKTFGYINTPIISPAPCTPMSCSMTYPEVPPVLELQKSDTQSSIYPQRISCNINKIAAPLAPEMSTSVAATCARPQRNKSGISGSSYLAWGVNESVRTVAKWEEENLWRGNLDYEEYQFNGASNLFITWIDSKAELIKKLNQFNLKVREVLSTRDKNICNVIFETHPTARKAFTMQQQIRLRIVPPKNSSRIWFRNPCPTFLVNYETKCRLTVRKGKAESHDIVGELLQGCLITANQLKGNRVRVICCEGRFMFPGGKVVEMKGVQDSMEKEASLGWISYRCKYNNQPFLIRRSSNMLSDYIYHK